MSASRARAALPALLDRVEHGDEVTITRHGRPVAVMVAPDRVPVRRAEATIDAGRRLWEAIEAARRRPLADRGLSVDQAADLVAEVRLSRTHR